MTKIGLFPIICLLDVQLLVWGSKNRLHSTGMVPDEATILVLWSLVTGIPVAAKVDRKQVLSLRGMLVMFAICWL
jgi:hypothetical protein